MASEEYNTNSSSVKTVTDMYIIGVGASAGGLEALYALFENPTPDNATFIIIQHLPPDYKSNMALLLASHSKRKILEVESNMVVEPNAVYVMTERKNIILRKGRIFTSDDGGKQPNNLIDVFLNSLAEDKGDKSIAIILSGSNNDGTKGAEAIKNANGLVIVQDPATAQFDTMPNSVITSGNVDTILAPELILKELTDYIKQGDLMNQFTGNNEATLLEVLDLISHNTELDFAKYKRTTIIRRIQRRMVQNNLNSLDNYVRFLKENKEEIDILSKEFMISVTKFFRDSPAFEIIREKVLPDIIQNKSPKEILKIWVVGCATGEEAYSIAMLLNEHLTETNKQLDVKIFASDIDQKALAVASKGIYPESISRIF